MNADLNSINLTSRNFAALLEVDRPVADLQDCVIYDNCVDSDEYRQAIRCVRESFANSKMRDIKKNVMAVTDRAARARNSEYKLKLKKREKGNVSNKLNDAYSYRLHLEGKDHSPIPIKMQKSSFTIYVMSMIEKVTENGKDAVVNVRSNMDAYVEVNRQLFGIDYKETVESFKKLDLRIGNTSQKNRRGQLDCCYSDIEAALEITFDDTGRGFFPIFDRRACAIGNPKGKSHHRRRFQICQNSLKLPENGIS